MIESLWGPVGPPEPDRPAPVAVTQARLIREQFEALKPADLRPLLQQILDEQRRQNARLKKIHHWVFWSGLMCFIALLPLMTLIVLIAIGLITGGIAGVFHAIK